MSARRSIRPVQTPLAVERQRVAACDDIAERADVPECFARHSQIRARLAAASRQYRDLLT